MAGGALVVVGTGYRAVGDITLEAQGCIRGSDVVYYLVSDPLCVDYILKLNQAAESLHVHYAAGKHRALSYTEMTDRIMATVREGRMVCAAFYGHPGVFGTPSHAAVQQAREEGFPARMLPVASAEDWLFADLGLDPGRWGFQSFEASDFLLYERVFDPTSLLVLWQVGVIGVTDAPSHDHDGSEGARVLAVVLLRAYPPDHEVIVYEASPYVVCEPRVERCSLASLPDIRLSRRSTLVVPPMPSRGANRDMAARLGFM